MGLKRRRGLVYKDEVNAALRWDVSDANDSELREFMIGCCGKETLRGRPQKRINGLWLRPKNLLPIA